MAVGAREYSVVTGGAVALAAAGTAKSILSVIAAANDVAKVTSIAVGFDGVSASEKPILVEVCRSTQAGTGTSSSVTPALVSGAGNIRASSGKNYTAEPTVLTVVEEFLVDPNKGGLLEQLPLGREIESPVAGAVVVRMTVPSGGAAVNTRVTMKGEE